ncbi:uncharacterized protein A1O9_11337 [Exophiala aquamarina CBS 119918]|uniref:Transcription factor domain-containing protein n=1 Tax=Exophiala aquamarina CBS 119918 TaxID=1182545 RepID=A0A072PA86_9EURO|nr:uncharacterized protein A1O9_11337 [Exophiala aquamarina CBS 119918]KEF52495.1 hypothetical protein A1O9_11337 [Exophiala aquamarina CBS 119918]
MHQFTAFTYKSVSVPTINEETWQVFVPRQALKYDFLMHAILGLAALHLSVEASDNREEYQQSSLDHQNRGFTGFSEALSNIDETNCHAMFAFAVIAMIFAIASPQDVATSNNKDFDRVILLCDFMQGIATVAVVGWQWIKEGPFAMFLDIDNSIALEDVNAEDEEIINRLHKFNDKFLAVVDPTAHMTIASAITVLEKCIRGGDMMALAWLALCGKHFLALLGQRQRLAQLVFIHWTLLLNRMNRVWWVRETTKLWFNETSSQLVGLGPEWLEAVERIKSKLCLHVAT